MAICSAGFKLSGAPGHCRKRRSNTEILLKVIISRKSTPWVLVPTSPRINPALSVTRYSTHNQPPPWSPRRVL
ncbi:hypothetical protein EVAR_22657_1 [Eumeta japonica]|uniref:Uncharacterized protein n=1 Tax=Eumeta variegata TaxID=151549 RepID=A0A4C1VL28_EUMVA|nr:hypothetical protein EVAR_22657_1 [Eumeta japonica]